MSSRDPGAVVRRHSLGTIDPHAPVVTGMVGARIETADGSHWFDASTGGFGSGHPKATAAIAEQAGRVALSSRILLSRPLAEAVKALDAFCPDPLTVSYLCNSGGEALDSALKLAKGTHPGRSRVLGIAGENFGTLTHGQGLSTGATPVPVLPLRRPSGTRCGIRRCWPAPAASRPCPLAPRRLRSSRSSPRTCPSGRPPSARA